MTKILNSIVHIGLHKTGTTSIQHFLQMKRDRLEQLGFHFYKGMHIDGNHVELHAAAMRSDRTSTFKMKSNLVFDEAYLKMTSDRVREFLGKVESGSTIFSAEGLSLLRHLDETERLASILPDEVSIIVYCRNPTDYLRSHANQLRKSGIADTTEKTSHAYMEADTWMADYDLRLMSFRKTFGQDNVHVIDYDEVCGRDGGVIPSRIQLTSATGWSVSKNS